MQRQGQARHHGGHQPGQKPDVWKYFQNVDAGGQKSEILTCKQVDLNRDSKVDVVYYYDDKGTQATMEEADLDFDGQVRSQHLLRGGQEGPPGAGHELRPPRRHLEVLRGREAGSHRADTNSDGKVDAWEYYEGGKLDRIGYDTTGSGKVDRWDRAPENEEGGGEAAAPAGAAPAATTPPAAGAAATPAGKAATGPAASTSPPSPTAPSAAAAPAAKAAPAVGNTPAAPKTTAAVANTPPAAKKN